MTTRAHPTECGLFDPSHIFVCTEPKRHEGAHIALTDDGYECERWTTGPRTNPQANAAAQTDD